MEGDDDRSEIISAELEEGISISIQATPLGGQELVGTLPGPHVFKEVTDTVESLARAMVGTPTVAKPSRRGSAMVSSTRSQCFKAA